MAERRCGPVNVLFVVSERQYMVTVLRDLLGNLRMGAYGADGDMQLSASVSVDVASVVTQLIHALIVRKFYKQPK